MRVVVRIFGQTLLGREAGRYEDRDGQTWVAVELDVPTVIGGCGAPRDCVSVVPEVVMPEASYLAAGGRL